MREEHRAIVPETLMSAATEEKNPQETWRSGITPRLQLRLIELHRRSASDYTFSPRDPRSPELVS
jgi:hypothetical protein